MPRFIYLIIIFFLLSNCSIDNKSGFWIDKKNPSREIELSGIDFDRKLKYEEFRDNVVLFSKQSKYPNIMEK